MFCDDSFLAASSEEIEQFSEAYRDAVGVPFFVLATPETVTDDKLSCLVDAGLRHVEMGIQSGSPTTLEAYGRPIHVYAGLGP